MILTATCCALYQEWMTYHPDDILLITEDGLDALNSQCERYLDPDFGPDEAAIHGFADYASFVERQRQLAGSTDADIAEWLKGRGSLIINKWKHDADVIYDFLDEHDWGQHYRVFPFTDVDGYRLDCEKQALFLKLRFG